MIKQIKYSPFNFNVHVKNSTEPIQRSWSNGHFHDIELLKFAEGHCKAGAIIDIGAGIGNQTMFFSRVMNRRVFAFEPDREKYEQLRKNAIANNLQTQLRPYALSSYAGYAHKGSESIQYFKDPETVFNIRVNILSSFIWERIGLIYVNVPNHTKEILSGGKRTIKEWKPNLIIKTELSPEEVVYYLKGMCKADYMYREKIKDNIYFFKGV